MGRDPGRFVGTAERRRHLGQVTPYLPGNGGGAGLTAPAVGIASTPDGGGYWLASANGGVFAFGDATFYNSLAGVDLAKPIVGIASTPDGKGYWLVASDGGIFAFGDAGYDGSMGGRPLDKPIVGIASTRTVGATGKWRLTAGSSPSATPPSTAPWVGTG